MSVTNPANATVTMVDGSIVDQFKMKYSLAANPVATVTVTPNYVTTTPAGNQYVQSLSSLNAAVPLDKQGSEMVLSVSAINVGGESPAQVNPDTVIVVNPPSQPVSVAAS